MYHKHVPIKRFVLMAHYVIFFIWFPQICRNNARTEFFINWPQRENPCLWGLRTTKAQTSLRIRAV